MNKLIFTLIILFTMASCNTKNVKDWTDQEVDTWFEASVWQNMQIKPDESIDKRSFVEQNLLNPKSWEAAYSFLKEEGLSEKELGKYELDGNGTYANIEEYTTKDSAHFEAHRKYIDIQYLVKGKEYIRISSMENITKEVSLYSEERDIEFFDKDEYTEHLLDGSNFIVLFPHQAHMPCMKVDSNMYVKKVVVKIPIVK